MLEQSGNQVARLIAAHILPCTIWLYSARGNYDPRKETHLPLSPLYNSLVCRGIIDPEASYPKGKILGILEVREVTKAEARVFAPGVHILPLGLQTLFITRRWELRTYQPAVRASKRGSDKWLDLRDTIPCNAEELCIANFEQ